MPRPGSPSSGQGSTYRDRALGSLGPDQRLGAPATAAGLVLAATRVFELAWGVKLPPNLDALLGAPWEEILGDILASPHSRSTGSVEGPSGGDSLHF